MDECEASNQEWIGVVPNDSLFIALALGPLSLASLIILVLLQVLGVPIGIIYAAPVYVLLIMGFFSSLSINRSAQWKLSLDKGSQTLILKKDKGVIVECPIDDLYVSPSGLLVCEQFIQTRYGTAGYVPDYIEKIWPSLNAGNSVTDLRLQLMLMKKGHVSTLTWLLLIVLLLAACAPLLYQQYLVFM